MRTVQSILLVVFISLSAMLAKSCRKHQESNEISGAYYEKGILWGLGSVKMGPLLSPGRLVLEKLTPADPADTAEAVKYGLYRMLDGTDAASKDSVLYVDRHPSAEDDGNVIYLYDLKIERRLGQPDWVDVYAILKRERGGFSLSGSRQLHLGSAPLKESAEWAAFEVAANLSVSLTASGPLLGRWALHQKDVLRDEEIAANYQCGAASVTPGQGESQTVGQAAITPCKLKNKIREICTKNSEHPECAEPSVEGFSNEIYAKDGEVTGAVHQGKGVFRLSEGEVGATFLFESKKINNPGSADQAAACQNLFYAVARDRHQQVHSGVVLKGAEGAEGIERQGLACRVTVEIPQALIYSDGPVFVTGVFAAPDVEEASTVVLLK